MEITKGEVSKSFPTIFVPFEILVYKWNLITNIIVRIVDGKGLNINWIMKLLKGVLVMTNWKYVRSVAVKEFLYFEPRQLVVGAIA